MLNALDFKANYVVSSWK